MTDDYFGFATILSCMSLFAFIRAGNDTILAYYRRYQLSQDEFLSRLNKLKGVNRLWSFDVIPTNTIGSHPFLILGIVAFIVSPFMLVNAFIKQQYVDCLASLVVSVLYFSLMIIAFKVPSSIFGNKMKPRTEKFKVS